MNLYCEPRGADWPIPDVDKLLEIAIKIYQDLWIHNLILEMKIDIKFHYRLEMRILGNC